MRGLLEIVKAHRQSRQQWEPQQANLGQDRRVFLRVSVQVPCHLNNPMFGLESSGRTVDLSLGGVGCVGPVNWPIGSRIRIGLEPMAFAAEGIVVYRKEEPPQFRYGIKFHNLGYIQIFKLRRFLKRKHNGYLSR